MLCLLFTWVLLLFSVNVSFRIYFSQLPTSGLTLLMFLEGIRFSNRLGNDICSKRSITMDSCLSTDQWTLSFKSFKWAISDALSWFDNIDDVAICGATGGAFMSSVVLIAFQSETRLSTEFWPYKLIIWSVSLSKFFTSLILYVLQFIKNYLKDSFPVNYLSILISEIFCLKFYDDI